MSNMDEGPGLSWVDWGQMGRVCSIRYISFEINTRIKIGSTTYFSRYKGARMYLYYIENIHIKYIGRIDSRSSTSPFTSLIYLLYYMPVIEIGGLTYV